MLKKAWARILLKTVFALGLIFLVVFELRGTSFDQLLIALRKFRLAILLPALALHCLPICLSILRTWLFLPDGTNGPIARPVTSGQLVNAFAPARAGDVLKAVLIHRGSKEQVSMLAAGAAILADKFMDLASMTLVLLTTGSVALAGQRWLAPVAALVFIVGIFLFRRYRIGSMKTVLLCLALGLLPWVGEISALRLLCDSLGYPVAWGSAVFSLSVLYFGILVPVAPANLGAFEAGLAFGLTRAGLPASEALAVGMLHHALQFGGLTACWLAARIRVPGRRPELEPASAR